MNGFIKTIMQLTNNKYEYLRVKSARYKVSKKLLEVTLLVPYNIYNSVFTNEDKQHIGNCLKKHYEDRFSLSISYEKSYCDITMLTDKVINYFKVYRTLSLIYLKKEDITVSINPSDIVIDIYIEPHMKLIYDNNKICEELNTYLSHHFSDKFIINYKLKDSDSDIICNLDNNSIMLDTTILGLHSSIIRVDIKDNVVGRGNVGAPVYISAIDSARDSETVAGSILSRRRLVSKEKNKPYYIFLVSDGTAKIVVKSFSRTTLDTDANNLIEGDEIICSGRIVVDEYEKRNSINGLVMLSSTIKKCVIDRSSIDIKNTYNKIPARYNIIKPYPYKEKEQASFLIEDRGIPDFLKNKSFTVFDLETTGLNASEDAIVEIAAVKIVNGVIIECYETLINPERRIPERATNIHNITDDMVKSAPTIREIIGEFLKFCSDSIVMSYNLSFDMSFINTAMRKYNYNIECEQMDILDLARKYVNSSKHNLETVCDYLNITLNDAHRALADTVAAAKVFMEIAYKIK